MENQLTENNVIEFKADEIKKMFEKVIEESTNIKCAIVIAVDKNHKPRIMFSNMTNYELAYLATTFNGYINKQMWK